MDDNSNMPSLANPIANAYLSFKDHSTGTNNNTELVILEGIRAAHPDQDVTPFAEAEFDVMGWAKAGKAQLTFLRNGRFAYTRRKYHAPENRLLEGGELGEKVTFGCYQLCFNGEKFQFYAAEWPYYMDRLTKKVFFVLSAKTDVSQSGYAESVDELLLAIGRWTFQLNEEIYVFDGYDWIKDSKLWKTVESCQWSDVILDQSMKQSLMDDVHGFFDSKAIYEEHAVPWKRGIIFHGIPGCGKTLSIKSLMKSLDDRDDAIPSLLVKTFEGCKNPQGGIKDSFDLARKMAPCLLVFEDLDSLITDQIRSYFLNEVDGLENNNGILIIATTNHLERLDPGLSKRPSRFDRKYHFKTPNEQERVLYCEHWRKRLETNSHIDFTSAICEAVAKITEGFSFAYLKELFVQSLLVMARDQALGIRNAEVNDSKQQTNLGEGNNQSGDGIVTVSPAPEASLLGHLQANHFARVLCDQVVVLRRDMQT